MKDKLPLNDKQLTLIKSAGVLLLVILLFTFLSRFMLSGGQTLAEYAEKNPELAYGTVSEDTADNSVSDEMENETNNNATDATENGANNNATDVTENGANNDSSSDSAVESARVTYQPEFYYEPLSEDLKNYITGISYPEDGAPEISYDDLAYVHVLHYDFDGKSTEGELICNQKIAQDLVEIFYELYLAEYQIGKITLIENYDGDDNASMADNNTSCFNYRVVDGTDNLSRHALGLAIDINPLYNPYVRYTKEGGQIILPEGGEDYADRTKSFHYKIDSSDFCYQVFLAHGFTWGGNWNSSKDYQHFQKSVD